MAGPCQAPCGARTGPGPAPSYIFCSAPAGRAERRGSAAGGTEPPSALVEGGDTLATCLPFNKLFLINEPRK